MTRERVRGACKAMNGCSGNSQQMTAPLDSMKKKRDTLSDNPKFKKVMCEYGEGTLKSSSGQAVTSQKQATAIAASESGQSYRKKQSDRSTADRFGIQKKRG